MPVLLLNKTKVKPYYLILLAQTAKYLEITQFHICIREILVIVTISMFLKNKMITLLCTVFIQRYNSKKISLFKLYNSVSRLFPKTLLITTSVHCRTLRSSVGPQLPDISITAQRRTFPITWFASGQQRQGAIICTAKLLKVISQRLVQNHNTGLFVA